jgi:hypothetical protein
MSRDRLTFRQRDLTAALKAAKDAGVTVRRIEVRKDAVVLIPGELEPEPVEDKTEPEDELAAALEVIKNAKI